jgi:hypothetical protein
MAHAIELPPLPVVAPLVAAALLPELAAVLPGAPPLPELAAVLPLAVLLLPVPPPLLPVVVVAE